MDITSIIRIVRNPHHSLVLKPRSFNSFFVIEYLAGFFILLSFCVIILVVLWKLVIIVMMMKMMDLCYFSDEHEKLLEVGKEKMTLLKGTTKPVPSTSLCSLTKLVSLSLSLEDTCIGKTLSFPTQLYM